MKFKKELVDLIGHCAPVEAIEAFADKLEGEVRAHVDWALSQVGLTEAAAKPAKPGKDVKADAVPAADAAK